LPKAWQFSLASFLWGQQEKGRAQLAGLKRGPNQPDFSPTKGLKNPKRKVLFGRFFLQEKA